MRKVRTKKLPSFTLAEMLVVLVISSIVIATGFLVLQMVRQQVEGIQKSYQKKQTVITFETLLYRDFSSYNPEFNASKNTLILKNFRDSIYYQFKDTYITRNKDTFNLEVISIHGYLDGIKIKEKEIDALEIELSKEFSNVALFLQRNKDASHYINSLDGI